MFYLIWALLNIAAFIFFLLLCFRATKLLSQNFGRFAALVFVIGLLSFINTGNKPGNSITNSMTQQFAPVETVTNPRFTQTSIKDNWISDYELLVFYGNSKQDSLPTVVSVTANLNGFVSGTTWKPSSISIQRGSVAHELNYSVTATTEWKLLGFTLFTQGKEYNGVIPVR